MLVEHPAGAGHRAHRGGDQGVGGEVDGEGDPLGREHHHRAVVGVVEAGEHQVDAAPAQLKGHALRIGDVGLGDAGDLPPVGAADVPGVALVHGLERAAPHAAGGEVLEGGDDHLLVVEHAVVVAVGHVAGHVRPAPVHVGQGPFLGDDMRVIVGEDRGAGGMVPVGVAIDDVAHRLAGEAPGQFALQPGREVGADGVDQEQAVGGVVDQAPPVAVAGAPEVVLDLHEGARRAARGRGGRQLLRAGGLGHGAAAGQGADRGQGEGQARDRLQAGTGRHALPPGMFSSLLEPARGLSAQVAYPCIPTIASQTALH